MPEIIIIGSSSGDPSIDRTNAAILVKHKDKMYQFDAGEGCSSSIKRQKIDHSSIDDIFISHMHPDHITGLFLEIQMMFLAKRRVPLKVYLPEEAMAPVENFMKATYLFEDKMGFETKLCLIKPDPIFRGDNVTIYARANSHLEKYKEYIDRAGPPNKMESYSFAIKTDDVKIVYSGDIGSSDDFADLLPGCNVLITEGMHIDQEKLFAQVASFNIDHLILTHLSDDMYRNPDTIISSAQKQGVKSIYIAKDGLILSV